MIFIVVAADVDHRVAAFFARTVAASKAGIATIESESGVIGQNVMDKAVSATIRAINKARRAPKPKPPVHLPLGAIREQFSLNAATAQHSTA